MPATPGADEPFNSQWIHCDCEECAQAETLDLVQRVLQTPKPSLKHLSIHIALGRSLPSVDVEDISAGLANLSQLSIDVNRVSDGRQSRANSLHFLSGKLLEIVQAATGVRYLTMSNIETEPFAEIDPCVMPLVSLRLEKSDVRPALGNTGQL